MKKHPIKLGLRDGIKIEIKEGLTADNKVRGAVIDLKERSEIINFGILKQYHYFYVEIKNFFCLLNNLFMMKKYILIISLLHPFFLFGQDFENKTDKNDDVIASFMRLSTQQLFDTANYYSGRNSYDTALICYNMLINTIHKSAEYEQQIMLLRTYSAMAIMYVTVSEYHIAYDYFIKALLISEKYNLTDIKSRLYANLGVVYNNLNQHEIANQYFLRALDLSEDTVSMVLMLNNIGSNAILRGKMDSAYYYLGKSIKLSKRHEDVHLNSIYNNLASFYQNKKQYDSAFFYFRLSLYYSKIANNIKTEATNLSELGKMFFELNNPDSALYYIDLSNKIASENKFLKILSDNYLTLSEIDKSKGRFEDALNNHIIYTTLKDSIYNAEVYSRVNLHQRQYEVSKTNHEIEELVIDRQIKENTILYQKIILQIIITFSFFMGIILFFIIFQNKKLKKAYNILVDKNVEIIKLENETLNIEPVPVNIEPEPVNTEPVNTEPELVKIESETINVESETVNIETKTKINSETKPKNNILADQFIKELLDKILTVMKDPVTYCDPTFSVDKLASITQSNHNYVSTAIKNSFNKNFKAFLNSYRIKEAQRIIMELDTKQFTIDSVVEKVGFKSRSGFYDAFKEITGVSPTYYLKSLQEETPVNLK